MEENYQGSFYLLQVAEVAAIADVYDALCSDRPRRPALPLEAATRELQKLAGSHPNAEMVDVFLSIVPAWPLGSLVRLDGGDWDGARCVVVQQDRIDPRKPFVRVYEDAEGKRCRETLQTGKLPDVRVEQETARESTPRAKGADSVAAAEPSVSLPFLSRIRQLSSGSPLPPGNHDNLGSLNAVWTRAG